VHFCEQILWPSVSNELVHTPLVHSVDVSLAVVQVAPNGKFDPAAGASVLIVGVSAEHAASRMANATVFSMMAP